MELELPPRITVAIDGDLSTLSNDQLSSLRTFIYGLEPNPRTKRWDTWKANFELVYAEQRRRARENEKPFA